MGPARREFRASTVMKIQWGQQMRRSSFEPFAEVRGFGFALVLALACLSGGCSLFTPEADSPPVESELPLAGVSEVPPGAVAEEPPGDAEELLALLREIDQAGDDRTTVSLALRRSMDVMGPAQKLEFFGKNFPSSSMGDWGNFWFPRFTLTRAIEECDVVVRAIVEEVRFDWDAHYERVLEQTSSVFGSFGQWWVTIPAVVTLRISEHYPLEPSLAGTALKLPMEFHQDHLSELEAGKEYLIALRLDRNGDLGFLPHGYVEGIYPMDAEADKVGMLRGVEQGPPDNIKYPNMNIASLIYGIEAHSVTVDEAWNIVSERYDRIVLGVPPDEAEGDFHLMQLRGGSLDEAEEAITFFWENPVAEPTATELAEAIEHQYENLLAAVAAGEKKGSLVRRFNEFVSKAGRLINPPEDDAAVARLFELYIRDRDNDGDLHRTQPPPDGELFREHGLQFIGRGFYVTLARLVLNQASPERVDRIRTLLARPPVESRDSSKWQRYVIDMIGTTDGEDIDALLLGILETPREYGLSSLSESRQVWEALATRGRPEIYDYLADILPRLDEFPVEFVPSNDGPPIFYGKPSDDIVLFAVSALRILAQGEVKRGESLELLVEIQERGLTETSYWVVQLLTEEDAHLIARLVQYIDDPETDAEGLIPVLIPASNRDVDPKTMSSALLALRAVGRLADASEVAMRRLEWVTEGSESVFPTGEDPEGREVTAIQYRLMPSSFFIESAALRTDPAADALLLKLTDEAFMKERIPNLGDQFWGFDEGRIIRDYVIVPAIFWLARSGDERAVPRLKELYKSDDIVVKIAAALGLHYLGDDSASELIEKIADGSYIELPEIQDRWGMDTTGLEAIITPMLGPLRSPQIEDLLNAHILSGLDNVEMIAFEGNYVSSAGLRYIRETNSDLMAGLVENLGRREADRRGQAYKLLVGMTGETFGYVPERPIVAQEDALMRWQHYAAEIMVGGG